ncbi:MAG: FHA domain-containing protein [Myxococcaceae bacterium]|nr:FHA domain-containing protein [Myxococcaceae bacterium]
MATLLIRHPDGTEEERELEGELSVGRADGNELVLTEGGVSRKHARFFTDGEELKVEDVGSANGTFVDGERITGPTVVGPRAQVVIGDYELKLKGAAAASRRVSAPPPRGPGGGRGAKTTTVPSASAKPARATKVISAVDREAGASPRRPRPGTRASQAGPQLKGLSGAVLDRVFPLKGTMTVGRVSGVEITLEDDSVSRRHAELEVRDGEAVLRDLGSTNGTTVNGAPLAEEAVLQHGDVVQFGVVELAFEGAGGAAIVRRGADRPPVPRRGGAAASRAVEEPSVSGPVSASRKRLYVAAGVVGVVLFAGAMVQIFRPPPPVPVTPVGPRKGTVAVEPPSLEELLSECRQYSSIELGDPNFDRAEAACRKVLDQEPIHEEATNLLKRIKVDRQCQDNFFKATKALQRSDRDEEAMEAFEKIRDCSYFVKAAPLVREPMERLKNAAGRTCKEYVGSGVWDQAVAACEKYMRIACQSMTAEDLIPPATMRLNLSGTLKRGDWRPKDPMLLNLLRAREKTITNPPPWVCPDIPILRPPPAVAKPSDQARERFLTQYSDKELAGVMQLYFDGRVAEATKALERMTHVMSKAKDHPLFRSLSKQMADVVGLVKAGQDSLQDGKPEKAEQPFREALALDEALMLGDKAASMSADDKRKELEVLNSYFRHTINQDMASYSYKRGKDLADRTNFREACKIWKIGFSFWKGNPDLNRAVTNACTKRAVEMFPAAQDCAALEQVLQFAVPGDGIAEKVKDQKETLSCP